MFDEIEVINQYFDKSAQRDARGLHFAYFVRIFPTGFESCRKQCQPGSNLVVEFPQVVKRRRQPVQANINALLLICFIETLRQQAFIEQKSTGSTASTSMCGPMASLTLGFSQSQLRHQAGRKGRAQAQ